MQTLSWGELITVLIIAGVIWYGYVLSRYYPELFKRKKMPMQPVKWVREKETAKENNTDQHAQVHELMEELKLIFAAAIRDQLNAEQIKETISSRLRKYSSLDEKIKLSINHHIASEFSLQLKKQVDPEAINALWT